MLVIAEVFFVNVREHTGVKFGGRIGHVEDPKSGVPAETMVHGEFSFRVVDPEQLIVGLVGTGRAESYHGPFVDEGASAEGPAGPHRRAVREEQVASCST